MWNASYAAVRTHLKKGAWYGEVNMHLTSKQQATPHFESLQAFWPALQVLAGDVDEAAQSFAAFYEIWRRYRVLPERYDLQRQVVHPHVAAYPLRPELAESCYALYRATRSDAYLQAGAVMVASLNSVARTDVGFASIRSVITLEQDDHMTSFFLAETLKYLYLLFDEANFLNVHAASYVLTTEGHLLPLKTGFSSQALSAALPSAEALSTMGTVGLRHLIVSAGLSHEDCLEKEELRTRAKQAHTLLKQLVKQRASSASKAAEAEAEAKAEVGEDKQRIKHDDLVCGQPPLSTPPNQQQSPQLPQQQQQQQQQPQQPKAPPRPPHRAHTPQPLATVGAADATGATGAAGAAGAAARTNDEARTEYYRKVVSSSRSATSQGQEQGQEQSQDQEDEAPLPGYHPSSQEQEVVAAGGALLLRSSARGQP
eukprot:scaffold76310_cov72-Phaeocystis_antarctica.AAC.2